MVDEHAYFVTTRLKGSLPSRVVEALVRERETLLAAAPKAAELDALHQKQFRRIEDILDAAKFGPSHLRLERIAEMVLKGFDWLEQQKDWTLFAATIMPNHIHLVLQHFKGRNDQLSTDLGLFKGYTAREANRYLDRTGSPFWIDENFDHWCRNDDELLRKVRYTVENPVKAGLVQHWFDWPWTKVCQAFLPDLE